MKKKITKQIFFALIGAIIFSIIFSLILMLYGGNYCNLKPDMTYDCFCGELFTSKGYESCGLLGFYVGAVVGGILGFLIPNSRKK